MSLLTSNTYVNDGGGGRTSSVILEFDPVTGTWKPIPGAVISSILSRPQQSSQTPARSQTDVEEEAGNVNTQEEADKEYIEAEFNVLSGELKLTPTVKSIKIHVNDTVRIEGIGKYLSGLYFVSAISRTINKDSGYSHTFSLIKNGFGDSLKSRTTDSSEESRTEEVPKEAPELKIGDYVKIVGSNAIYSNNDEGVKVPEWVKKKTLTISKFNNDKTKVLVMPINSWTYVKYIMKV